MPVLAKPLVINPPTGGDPGTLPDPGGLPVDPPTPRTSITLYAADSTAFDLSTPDAYLALLGRKGFDSATYEVYTDESPGIDGEVYRSARALPRDLTLPVYIRGEDRVEFLARKRDLLARLSPARGLATLEVAEIDGTRRRLNVYATGRGMEGDASRDRGGRTWVKYEIGLTAPDPFWRGDPLHVEFQAGTSYKFLGASTFLPFRVQDTQSFGATQFVNPGDVMSYPVWKILGPTNGGIILSRVTPDLPNRTLTLNSVLSAGQTLTIDTRPEVLAITDQAGANRWPDLADGSSLWRIGPGTNLIEVSVGGSSSTTRVVLDAEPRYETA